MQSLTIVIGLFGTASSSCVFLATFAPNFSVYWWENSNNNIERRLIRRPHLYCNLFPVICLPTPLLPFVSVNIAHESTVLVPQCCDGRAALTVTKDLKQTGEACATEFCYTCIFTCYFIFFSKKKNMKRMEVTWHALTWEDAWRPRAQML